LAISLLEFSGVKLLAHLNRLKVLMGNLFLGGSGVQDSMRPGVD